MGMHHLPHIKALVLKAPFDSVGTIVDFMMQRDLALAGYHMLGRQCIHNTYSFAFSFFLQNYTINTLKVQKCSNRSFFIKTHKLVF